MSLKIKTIKAREILDSRGDPTVEAKVILENDLEAEAQVPSGASRGKFEAWELRDGDKKRYLGQGVLTACENINTHIAQALKGKEVANQKEIDEMMIELDGTENKSHLGANAILAVSLSVARAAAFAQNLALWQWIRKLQGRQNLGSQRRENKVAPLSRDLPLPCFNVINGGQHADNKLEFQEFWIIPLGAKSFQQAVRMGSEVFHHLQLLCKEKGYDTNVGNEGGFAPELDSNEQAINLIIEGIERAGYQLNKDFVLGLDVAATSFYEEGHYVFRGEGLSLSPEQLISLYSEWVDKYPIVTIEDGLAEEDWAGWIALNKRIGDKVQIVGDDLLVTNRERLKQAIQKKAANAILIKPNQIGTLTETLDCLKLAFKNNLGTIISHRSGETCDTFIADLAVGVQAGQIKAGSLCRSERTCKYNRLMEIEEEIKSKILNPKS